MPSLGNKYLFQTTISSVFQLQIFNKNAWRQKEILQLMQHFLRRNTFQVELLRLP